MQVFAPRYTREEERPRRPLAQGREPYVGIAHSPSLETHRAHPRPRRHHQHGRNRLPRPNRTSTPCDFARPCATSWRPRRLPSGCPEPGHGPRWPSPCRERPPCIHRGRGMASRGRSRAAAAARQRARRRARAAAAHGDALAAQPVRRHSHMKDERLQALRREVRRLHAPVHDLPVHRGSGERAIRRVGWAP